MQTLVVVDGPGLLRSLLGRHLQTCAPGLRLIEVDDTDALSQSHALSPSLVVLVHRTGMTVSALETAIGDVQRHLAGVPIGIVSEQDDYEAAQRVLSCGANGLISMRSCVSSLVPILQLLAAGETFVPCSALAGKDTVPALPPRQALVASAAYDVERVHLTQREDQILGALRLGKSNKEIARLLAIKENTVKIHLRHIFRKFGARSRCEAIVLAESKIWKAPAEQISYWSADLQQSTARNFIPQLPVKFDAPIRVP